MAVITEITEKTPIVMPIIVRAARSLFAPSEASAILMISLNNMFKIRTSEIPKSGTNTKFKETQNSVRPIYARLRRISFVSSRASVNSFALAEPNLRRHISSKRAN